MRKSQAKTGVRPLRVGAAVAVAAAAAVTGIVSPASAANEAITISPLQVPTQGGARIVVTAANAAFPSATNGSTTYTARFIGGTSPTCTGTSAPAVNTAATNPVYDAGTVQTPTSATVTVLHSAPVPAGSYKLCIWETGGTAPFIHSTAGTVLAVPYATLSAQTGPTGVTNVIQLNATGAFTAASHGVQLNNAAAGCPDKYTAASGSNIVVATNTKSGNNTLNVTVPATNVTSGVSYYVCAYNGTAANSSTLVSRSWTTYSPYATTLPAATVAPTTGTSGATNTNVTVTLPSGTIDLATTYGAIFTRNSCPLANIEDDVLTVNREQLQATVTNITTSKVAVAVPGTPGAAVVSGPRDATTAWNVCLYDVADDDGGKLIATPGVYTVAPELDLTGVLPSSNGTPSVDPDSGPAQGGTTVTISDLEGIPTAEGATLLVSLGGSPLTNVKAIDANSLTGTTTAHAPGRTNLTITTAAGTKSTTFDLAAVEGVFNYDYAIDVTPNTAPAVAGGAADNLLPVLDIMGAGFSNLSFENVPGADDAKAHVLLVDNGWYSQAVGGEGLTVGSTGLANPFAPTGGGAIQPITQCKNVLPIGDNELICRLDLGKTITGHATYASVLTPSTPVPAGTYSIVVINNGGDAPLFHTDYNYSVVTSGSTFTVAPF